MLKNKKLLDRLSPGQCRLPTKIKPLEKNTEESHKKRYLTLLQKRYEACTACPLAKQGRKQVVFGAGNPGARLMFIGEGPGRDEDIQGVPFVGRAGKLLNKIIEAMGFKREEVYISNVVKCRPPSNRTPLPEESFSCTNNILFKEIEIVRPELICPLGAPATKALLGQDAQIGKVRGILTYYKNTPVIPTYHPAYLLRNPAAKKATWEDMKKAIKFLSQNKPKT